VTSALLIARRMAEHRFFGDGASDASVLPNAIAILSASAFVGTLLIDTLRAEEIITVVACAVFAWTMIRGVLEYGELERRAAEHAFLAPQPIRPFDLAIARTMIVAIDVVISTLNLALPVAVMAGFRFGAQAAAGIFTASVLAVVFAISSAALVRRGLFGVLRVAGIRDAEGPIGFVTVLALFIGLVRSPQIDWSSLDSSSLRFLPPIVFSRLFTEGGLAIVAAAVASLVLVGAIALWSAGTKESENRRPPPKRARARVSEYVRRFISDPEELAGYDLATAGIRADRTFRARTWPLLAFPFASVVLASTGESDRSMVPMALFGATVYLVLSQSFLLYSESAGGPKLLSSLPISSESRFRLGGEKAYVACLVIPTHIAISFGIALFDVTQGDVQALLKNAGLGVVAALTSCLVVLETFPRAPGLPFGKPDRGLYQDDLSGAAFSALMLSTIAALVAMAALRNAAWFGLLCLVMLVLLWRCLRAKEQRCNPRIAAH
jgi:hypothetical protein